MSLTPKRVMRLKEGLNSTAQKAYNATPISEAWTVGQIMGELARTGHNTHVKGVHGSLRHLSEIGLVKEVRPNMYQQVPITRQPEQEEQIMATMNATLSVAKKEAPVPSNPFDAIQLRLAHLSKAIFALQDQITTISDEFLTLQVNQEEKDKKYQRVNELLEVLESLKK